MKHFDIYIYIYIYIYIDSYKCGTLIKLHIKVNNISKSKTEFIFDRNI